MTISSTKDGYLHNWIANNFRLIWPRLAVPPRFMGRNALNAALQHEAFQYGQALVARLVEAIPTSKQKEFEFQVLDLDQVNAWAVWAPACYGIFVTRGLVTKMQRICSYAPEFMRHGRHTPVRMNFLRDMWDGLPDDSAHYDAFATVLLHIALAFIVHHELAHAGLGHEGKVTSMNDGDPNADFIDEATMADAGRTLPSANRLRSQVLETDADVHALFYTRRLVLDEVEQFRTAENLPVGPAVFIHLLRNKRFQQMTVFMGVALGALMLTSGLEDERFGTTVSTAHPPMPSRLLLMFHAASSLSGHDEVFAECRSAAITTAIALISKYLKEAFGVDPHKPDEKVDQTEGHRRSKWEALRHVSVVDALFRIEEVSEYWETLVAKVREMKPALNQDARFPEMLRYEWYRSGSVN